MKIVWELREIVKTLTEKITGGNTKMINFESPSFTILMNGVKTKWHFRLACFDLTDGYVGIYLLLDEHPTLDTCKTSSSSAEPEPLDFEVKCRFACLNENREEVHRREGFMQFEPRKLCLGFRNFVHHSHILIPQSNIILDGTFYLTCTLYSTEGPDEYYSDEWIHTVLGEETAISTSVISIDSLWLIPPSVSHRRLQTPLHTPTTEMLHTMYTLGLFSDVQVNCGDKVFNLHKAVLSAWSEVFLAMFSSPMLERDGNVDVTDCKEETFENLVRFMYSEQVPEDETEVCELLIIADKYLIHRLKRICEQVLVESMSVDNISEKSELAVKHNCTLLKREIINFIKDNREELSHHDELKAVLLNDPNMLWKLSILERRRSNP